MADTLLVKKILPGRHTANIPVLVKLVATFSLGSVWGNRHTSTNIGPTYLLVHVRVTTILNCTHPAKAERQLVVIGGGDGGGGCGGGSSDVETIIRGGCVRGVRTAPGCVHYVCVCVRVRPATFCQSRSTGRGTLSQHKYCVSLLCLFGLCCGISVGLRVRVRVWDRERELMLNWRLRVRNDG